MRTMAFTLLALSLLWIRCGTNTEEPVFPVFSALAAVSAPAIVSVSAVQNDSVSPSRQEFNVSYFITNQEEGFVGYNLYISSSTTAAQGAFVTLSGEPYLEDGIPPSFKHVGASTSTASADLQTQRIIHFEAPPAPKSFQLCELYYFRMTAVLRTGLQSNPSAEQSACAATSAGLCPTGTPCNP